MRQLCDQIRFATFKPENNFLGVAEMTKQMNLPNSKKSFATLRNKLTSARRFILDDKLVENAVILSGREPSFLLRALPSALPPYDISWFEWNETIRINKLFELNLIPFKDENNVAGRVGLLIEKISETTYRITSYCDELHETQKVITFLFGTICNFENTNIVLSKQDQYITNLVQTEETKLGEYFSLGGNYLKTVATTPHDKEIANKIANHCSYCWGEGLGNILKTIETPKQITDNIIGSISGINGDFRFILSVLVMLNTIGSNVNYTKHIDAKRHVVSGKSIPYFSYSTVSIELPKEKLFSCIENKLTIHDEKRRHEVITHWCYRKNTGNPLCEHEWIRQTEYSNIRHICTKCGRLRWRRKEHERGNARKGFVIKDYNLKGKSFKKIII